MKKKFLRFALAIALPVAMVSCGGETTEGTDAETVETAAEEMVDEASNEAEAAVEEVVNEAESAVEEVTETGTYEEGSWAYGVNEYLANGTGSQTFVLDQVHLSDEAGDDAEISAEGQAQLDALASLLKAYPSLKAEVQGHSKQADTKVGRVTKKASSGIRATWVKNRLVNRGVEKDQLDSKGYADEMLIEGIDGKDEAQRRITISFTKE